MALINHGGQTRPARPHEIRCMRSLLAYHCQPVPDDPDEVVTAWLVFAPRLKPDMERLEGKAKGVPWSTTKNK